MVNLLLGAFIFAIPLIVFHLQLSKVLEREVRHSKSPFTEKLLTPAGESLRLKIDELKEDLAVSIFKISGALVLPIFLWFTAPMVTFSGKAILYFSVPALSYAFSIVEWRKFQNLRNDLRNYKLGFEGERYIGAELCRMEGNYHVFHDILWEKKPGGESSNFNFDHVVVGTNGIFVVETKTRRKRYLDNDATKTKYEVEFDGETLNFSNGYFDSKPIDQAESAARDLTRWLKDSLQLSIEIQPIVAIPGWKVNVKGKGKVLVLSGRGIAQRIALETKPLLDDETIKLVAARLEELNRCVEA